MILDRSVHTTRISPTLLEWNLKLASRWWLCVYDPLGTNKIHMVYLTINCFDTFHIVHVVKQFASASRTTLCCNSLFERYQCLRPLGSCSFARYKCLWPLGSYQGSKYPYQYWTFCMRIGIGSIDNISGIESEYWIFLYRQYPQY